MSELEEEPSANGERDKISWEETSEASLPSSHHHGIMATLNLESPGAHNCYSFCSWFIFAFTTVSLTYLVGAAAFSRCLPAEAAHTTPNPREVQEETDILESGAFFAELFASNNMADPAHEGSPFVQLAAYSPLNLDILILIMERILTREDLLSFMFTSSSLYKAGICLLLRLPIAVDIDNLHPLHEFLKSKAPSSFRALHDIYLSFDEFPEDEEMEQEDVDAIVDILSRATNLKELQIHREILHQSDDIGDAIAALPTLQDLVILGQYEDDLDDYDTNMEGVLTQLNSPLRSVDLHFFGKQDIDILPLLRNFQNSLKSARLSYITFLHSDFRYVSLTSLALSCATQLPLAAMASAFPNLRELVITFTGIEFGLYLPSDVRTENIQFQQALSSPIWKLSTFDTDMEGLYALGLQFHVPDVMIAEHTSVAWSSMDPDPTWLRDTMLQLRPVRLYIDELSLGDPESSLSVYLHKGMDALRFLKITVQLLGLNRAKVELRKEYGLQDKLIQDFASFADAVEPHLMTLFIKIRACEQAGDEYLDQFDKGTLVRHIMDMIPSLKVVKIKSDMAAGETKQQQWLRCDSGDVSEVPPERQSEVEKLESELHSMVRQDLCYSLTRKRDCVKSKSSVTWRYPLRLALRVGVPPGAINACHSTPLRLSAEFSTYIAHCLCWPSLQFPPYFTFRQPPASFASFLAHTHPARHHRRQTATMADSESTSGSLASGIRAPYSPLNFDLLTSIMKCIPEMADLLSFMRTCSELHKAGIPSLLSFPFFISPRNLHGFHEFMVSRADSNFKALRDLHLIYRLYGPPLGTYRTFTSDDLAIVVEILRKATALKALHVDGEALAQYPELPLAITSLTALEALTVDDYDERAGPILNNLQSPLTSVEIIFQDNDEDNPADVLAALANFRKTLRRACIESGRFITMGLVYPVLTSLELSGAQPRLSVLGPSLPNLETLILGAVYILIGDAAIMLLREENIRFQQDRTSPVWEKLSSLSAGLDGLYALGLQFHVPHVEIIDIHQLQDLKAPWLPSSMSSLRPETLVLRGLCYPTNPNSFSQILLRGVDDLKELHISAYLDDDLTDEDSLATFIHELEPLAKSKPRLSVFSCCIESWGCPDTLCLDSNIVARFGPAAFAQRVLDTVPSAQYVRLKVVIGDTDQVRHWTRHEPSRIWIRELDPAEYPDFFKGYADFDRVRLLQYVPLEEVISGSPSP
ncbi:hypothetical protein NM688_g5791 [Phlebia brevispora]|uniref:Uncharacterized protein n=1 Tax=Phlebia brevispora TaxID=194682 RepID=A0ACC1SPU2_9APHY|nr:hypothetical protein NM688_g5791 [Phlebia brevispora]